MMSPTLSKPYSGSPLGAVSPSKPMPEKKQSLGIIIELHLPVCGPNVAEMREELELRES